MDKARIQREINAACDRLDAGQLNAIAAQLHRIKLQWDAGSLSTLEAGIEQLKVMLEIYPIAIGEELVSALEAFNEGDDAELRSLLGKD